MRFPSTALPLVACLALAIGLAACGRGQPVSAICPQSGIIHGLDRLHAEAPGGGTVNATLENIDGVCTHGGGVLAVDMSIDVVIEAPAGTTIPYFVVITDPAGEILDKVPFAATVPADAAPGQLRLRERLYQEITNVSASDARAYTVLFGFDLPPDVALEQRRAL